MITIEGIPVTARWTAVFRARETRRREPLFRDPFARRLAKAADGGLRGRTPFTPHGSWAAAVRTRLMDQMLLREVRRGADLVLNLGAGLDARPYRMTLPRSLQWIEVDLPHVIRYKERVLIDETPVCHLQ